MKRMRFTVVSALMLVAAAAIAGLFGLTPALLAAAAGRMLQFGAALFPPNAAVLPQLLAALWETILIAFTGTVFGFALALPASFFATRTLFGSGVSALLRLLIGALRSIPSILLGVVAVVAFGLGPLAGVFGIAFYTLGYLGKLYAEAFEAVDPEVLEAVRSAGGTRLQWWRFGVLPEAMPAVVSQLLFMFEYNIRASTILGFVGAGGIGYYMLGYVQMLQYQPLLSAVLLTFAAVMLVDAASARLRRSLFPRGN